MGIPDLHGVGRCCAGIVSNCLTMAADCPDRSVSGKRAGGPPDEFAQFGIGPGHPVQVIRCRQRKCSQGVGKGVGNRFGSGVDNAWNNGLDIDYRQVESVNACS